MQINLSERNLATVLAALRWWQQTFDREGVPLWDHFDHLLPLTPDEIDDLCEQLNAD